MNRLTVVVMSEFGRRVAQNSDSGTDHGHGNNLLVMSGHATGGLHGAWPGLHPDQLADGDVQVTTDFRRVLAEILVRRLGNPRVIGGHHHAGHHTHAHSPAVHPLDQGVAG